jgi:hypothetical protein
MTHVRALLSTLRGRRRPPTGPLTTEEKTIADDLRTQNVLRDSERAQHEQDERR